MLVGNKLDMAGPSEEARAEQDHVQTRDAKNFAEANDIEVFMEVSATKYVEVEEAFIQSAEKIYEVVGEDAANEAAAVSLLAEKGKTADGKCC